MATLRNLCTMSSLPASTSLTWRSYFSRIFNYVIQLQRFPELANMQGVNLDMKCIATMIEKLYRLTPEVFGFNAACQHALFLCGFAPEQHMTADNRICLSGWRCPEGEDLALKNAELACVGDSFLTMVLSIDQKAMPKKQKPAHTPQPEFLAGINSNIHFNSMCGAKLNNVSTGIESAFRQ